LTPIQKIKLLLFKLFRTAYKKRLYRDINKNTELTLMGHLLKQTQLFFIDVGANRGEFIYVAEKNIAREKIWAIEPLPWFAEKLKALFGGITVINLGLSDSVGRATLYVPVKNEVPDDSLSSVNKPADSSFNTYEIALDTLDNLVQARGLKDPCFLKIDVEGHEFSVIAGAAHLISTRVQVMLVEIEERHHPGKKLSEMIADLEKKGFAAYYLHPQKRQLISFTEEPVVFQKEADLNTPFYVNNFWFFAKQFNPITVVASLNQTLS